MKKIILISALAFFPWAFAKSAELSQDLPECNYTIKELVGNINEESIKNKKNLEFVEMLDSSATVEPKYCNSYKYENGSVVFGYYEISSKTSLDFKSAGFVYFIDKNGNLLDNNSSIDVVPNFTTTKVFDGFLDSKRENLFLIGYLDSYGLLAQQFAPTDFNIVNTVFISKFELKSREFIKTIPIKTNSYVDLKNKTMIPLHFNKKSFDGLAVYYHPIKNNTENDSFNLGKRKLIIIDEDLDSIYDGFVRSKLLLSEKKKY
jgi:hypothetical protein